MKRFLLILLLTIGILTGVFYSSMKTDTMDEETYRQEFVMGFVNDFIAFHAGEKEALNGYDDMRVRNYQAAVLRRETIKFDLLQQAVWDRTQVVTDFGQSPGVHPDEEVGPLNYDGDDRKLEGQELVDYIMSLPYDQERLELIRDANGNVIKVLYDPSQSIIITDYVEVLFAGSRAQIFRKEMRFSYEDMQTQTMYNSLKKVNESVSVAGKKHRYTFKLDSLVQTGFHILITFDGTHLVGIEIEEFKN